MIMKKIKFAVLSRIYYLMDKCFPSKIKDARDIPIIINNYNRKETLLRLLRSLEKRGYNNIYIIDNQSTYPPLLTYYRECPYKVFRLKENKGFKALWKSELRRLFCRDYYIYTDSDVVLNDDCPDDVVDHLFRLMKKYKYAFKIGLSLRIDNLPDCYLQKNEVIAWEGKFFTNKNSDDLYRVPVDTTFALYRPKVGLSRSRYAEAYRTAYPYQLEHLPWYVDSANLTEEEKYYKESCTQATMWSHK